MTAFYNEIDPYAAQWLRNLINAGHIAPGVVDERSIEDIEPAELAQYTQCHFFAGIGGWSYALRLAGWSDDRPVWTGSCPCQPFSTAGKGAGFADERHLWPAFHHLISQCRPPIVFGEQVASKDGLVWLDLVRADLEATGYTLGAADLCAAGVGAPHIRQRLYWVADADVGSKGVVGGSNYCVGERGSWVSRTGHWGGGTDVRLADAYESRVRGQPGGVDCTQASAGHREHLHDPLASGNAGFWSPADWLPCRDGKWRPVEPGTFPLAHGVPNRVGRLRGYGNAIVPQVAQTFIEAYLSC